MVERPTLIQQWYRLSLAARALLIACIAAAPLIGFMSVMSGILGHGRPVFLLAVPLALILLLAVLVSPYGLLLFILLTRGGLDPFLEATKIPLGSASMGLGGVLNGLIIFLAIILARQTKSETLRSALRWSAPLVLVIAIACMRSPNIGEAVKFILGIATFISAFAIGVILTERKGLDYTLRMILYASVPAILLSIFMLLTGWSGPSAAVGAGDAISAAGRFAGAFSHPNIMAFFLTNTVVIALYFLARKNSTGARPHAYSLFLMLVSAGGLIVASKTRSAWAATAIILCVYAALFHRKLLVYLVLGGIGALFVPAVQDRLVDLSDDRGYLIYSTLNSYAWRKQLWSDALAFLSWQGWLWGNGIRSFFTDSTTFFKLSGGTPFGAHSIYVQLIYETGIIGLISWLTPLIGLAYRFARTWHSEKNAAFTGLCLIVAYMTVCYSDNILSYLVYNIYFWLALGAIMGAPKQAR